MRRKRFFLSRRLFLLTTPAERISVHVFQKIWNTPHPLPIIFCHLRYHWTLFYQFQSLPLGKTRQFWSSSYIFWGITQLHRQNLSSLFFSMTFRLLLCLQQQRYLSQFNSSHTHLAFVVLPYACVCAKTAVCVVTEWTRSRKKSA